MKHALPLLLLLACNPAPISPTVPLSAQDRSEVARMLELWTAHGLPDPGDCGRDAEIVWPASPADVAQWCKRPACETGARPCSQACQTSRRTGFGPFGSRVPLLVVSRELPRKAWVHEALHLLQRCAGLPRVHDESFMRVLDAVEGRKQ